MLCPCNYYLQAYCIGTHVRLELIITIIPLKLLLHVDKQFLLVNKLETIVFSLFVFQSFLGLVLAHLQYKRGECILKILSQLCSIYSLMPVPSG